MDTCDSQGSDLHSFNSDFTYIGEQAESPSLSDSSTARTTQSDEEAVLLASSRRKKRAGRRVYKETRHPVYHGVRRRNKDKWVSELRAPNKKTRLWLGTYPTAEMAARAHDVASMVLRGKRACLNFADSARRLQLPASADAADIRRAAAEAAGVFQPHEASGEEVSPGHGADAKEHGKESQLSSPPEMNVMILPEILMAPTEDSGNIGDGADEELVNLAEWIDLPLLSPPPSCSGRPVIDWDRYDAECHDMDLTLWSYSI